MSRCWQWEAAGAAPCQTDGSTGSTVDPPQDTAGPISWAGGTSVKICLRKVKNDGGERGGGNRKCETAKVTPRPEEEMVEVLHGRADIPCSPWRTHLGAGGEVWKGRNGKVVLIAASHPLLPLHATGFAEGIECKLQWYKAGERSVEWSWAWERRCERCLP